MGNQIDKMKYSLDIREENVPAHLDIEKDIHKKANGVFTFTIKLNNGKIVDTLLFVVPNARFKGFSTGSLFL